MYYSKVIVECIKYKNINKLLWFVGFKYIKIFYKQLYFIKCNFQFKPYL